MSQGIRRNQYILQGLDCANCADKISRKAKSLEGVASATLSFVSRELVIECRGERQKAIETELADYIKSIEPDVKMIEKGKFQSDKTDGKSVKQDIAEIIISVVLLAAGFVFERIFHPEPALSILFVCQTIVFVAAYLLAGHGVLMTAFRNIRKGEIFDENFLMMIATIGAFCIGEFEEAVAVMLFYRVGEMFQSLAVNSSRKSIASLMDIRPDFAAVKKNGKITTVDPTAVEIGDIVVVKAGERVPLDGIVVAGATSLNTAALTGESAPLDVTVGDNVLSGSVNMSGLIEVEVQKPYGESTVQKILAMVEEAESRKAPTESFITRFARIYTPIVVLIAAIISIAVPLIFSLPFAEWVYRGLVFLVVSCPCALVISVPLGYFSGLGKASKEGVLIKGGNYLDALTRVRTIAFDKTGTLTKGTFVVEKLLPNGDNMTDEAELTELAAYAEHFSTHPIATAVKQLYSGKVEERLISEYHEYSGEGISVLYGDKRVLAGNHRLMENNGISVPKIDQTHIHIAADGEYKGAILVADQIKETAEIAVKQLKQGGCAKTVMLSGDNAEAAEKVASAVGIDEVHAGLLPDGKVRVAEQLKAELGKGETFCFIGDGINDAPVLTLADIGVAMGGVGSDSAIEAADVVIMNDDPNRLNKAITVAKRTRRIIIQNVTLALVIKTVVQVLSMFGLATMWAAVFADVGVTVLAILNSMRILRSR